MGIYVNTVNELINAITTGLSGVSVRTGIVIAEKIVDTHIPMIEIYDLRVNETDSDTQVSNNHISQVPAEARLNLWHRQGAFTELIALDEKLRDTLSSSTFNGYIFSTSVTDEGIVDQTGDYIAKGNLIEFILAKRYSLNERSITV